MDASLAVVLTTLSIYVAVVVSPGPNFALISRLATSGSRTAGMLAALGIAIAATSYAALTMAGLSVLLTEIGWLSRAIQIAGGLYLIYLGISAWRSPPAVESSATPATTSGKAFRTALIVAFANPKSIAFFVGLYTLSIPPGTPMWAKLAILGGGFAIEFLWYALVAALLTTRRARAFYARAGRWIERAIGTLLAGFGVKLVAQNS